MTARALLWKEALVLSRCRWLFICVPIALFLPLAANIMATSPLFELDTCFLILSVAISCMGGELVFRTIVGERSSGTLDVLLTGVRNKLLLSLGKILLPSTVGALSTLAGLALNNLAAPLYAGKALYVGMLTPTVLTAVLFTSLICGLLELVLLMRSREEIPLHGSTALIFTLTGFMSCLYVLGGRVHPLLPVTVSALLLVLCLALAARSLSRPRVVTAAQPLRPDVLELAVSPLTSLAAKNLAAVHSWLRLLGRYALLIAVGVIASRGKSALALAAWFPALAFPAAELLYPALVRELTSGALDVLRTALGSRAKAYLYKCAVPLVAAQPGVIAATLFSAQRGTPALAALTVFESYVLVSTALATLIFQSIRSPAQVRTSHVVLCLLLAAAYALAALILVI